MVVCIQIVSLSDGSESPFDGQYLVEYDPSRPGVDPRGEPMTAHLVTTPNRGNAREFRNTLEALECWRQAHGTRPDGKPNRPLTAYHVMVS